MVWASCDAAPRQQRVELGQIGAAQPRREDVLPHMTDLVLDLSLLPPGRRRAGHRLDQVVAGHLQELAVVLPRLAGEDQLDRGLEIVVDPALAAAAPQAERPPVGIEHHLLGFAQIRHRQEHAGVTQAQVGDLHRRRPTAQVDRLVAPVELVRLSRREALRDEDGAGAMPALLVPRLDEALHRRIRAGETVLRQSIQQPLGGALLLARSLRVRGQHRLQLLHPRPHHRGALRALLVPRLGDLAVQVLRYRIARGRQPLRNLADAELVHSVPAPDLADRFHADHSRSLRKSRSLSGCSLLRDQTASNLLSIA